MSVTPLHAQKEQYVCQVCHKPIEDGEHAVLVMVCVPIHHIPGHEDGDWIVQMDWADFDILHDACLSDY